MNEKTTKYTILQYIKLFFYDLFNLWVFIKNPLLEIEDGNDQDNENKKIINETI
jgi:hypothetical protein